MAPRTPKDSETKPAKAKPAARAKPVAAKPAAAKAAAPKPAKPGLKVVEKSAPAAAKAGLMKLKDLVDGVAAATGGKKPEVKKTIEATLAAIGTALAASQSLALPPLGKLRVAKSTGAALTLKLRLADKSKAAGITLADDGEDE